MKKFGFGKKSDDGDDANRNALFGSRKKNSTPAPSENPYANQGTNDPYAEQTKYANMSSQGGANNGGRPSPPGNAYGSYQGGQNASQQSAPSGYGSDRYGSGGGYGSNRYDSGPGSNNYNAPATGARGPGGYGGFGRDAPDSNRDALFAGAQERLEKKQQPPAASGASNPQSGTSGGSYGGYGEQRELTEEEQEEADYQAILAEKRQVQQESVASVSRSVQMARQANEVGRATLARLGAQGERLHNTEKNLDLAANQNKIAQDRAAELKTLNGSMFAVHVGNPFTSKQRQAKADEEILARHRSEREQREITRRDGYAATQRMEQNMRQLGATGTGRQQGRKKDYGKFNLDDEEGADELEDQIDDGLTELEGQVKMMNMVGRAIGQEVDAQNKQIDRDSSHCLQPVSQSLTIMMLHSQGILRSNCYTRVAMASVFTYDPDPPRVSSPWILADDTDNPQASGVFVTQTPFQPQTGLLSEYGVTRLEAEPQTGPIEYKLHLLLRSRRSYVYMSTVDQKRDRLHAQTGDGSAQYSASPTPATSNQPRQERLQRLTTQLLWRLQQSSPYHASSSREVRIPKLPDGRADADSPDLFGTQVPGLEESQGALYEIGVSDDGSLIGLTRDELNESIATLRVMAASLGCGVAVMRMVIVGDCEWIEMADLDDDAARKPAQASKQDKLWVAEALITPNTEMQHSKPLKGVKSRNEPVGEFPLKSTTPATVLGHGKSTTPQLRVTLTGPTASGKSSLLGTLSTGALDNGRGKSRLGLLKHRHEMASGMTSSIAQELIGYKERHIFSFFHRNIESWLDIHDYSSNGRLVLMSDSGGHPRYRHTVFRGLLNWAPHWMILCIAADDAEATSRAHDTAAPGPDSGDTDLVNAHLHLSLKLDVPLAIVITKLDLASKLSLQKTMTKILAAIREADRVPKLLQPDQQPRDQLSEIPQTDWDKAKGLVENMPEHGDLARHVPIVFTSVLKGVGIGLVHALLASLPLPPAPMPYVSVEATPQQPDQPKNLFHIDDTFSLPRSFEDLPANLEGVIASGHVRLGSFSVGQTIVVGPFLSGHAFERASLGSEYQSSPDDRGSPTLHAMLNEHVSTTKMNGTSPCATADEWQKGRIVSIRNLRLPVGTLEAGQVGSIGLVFEPSPNELGPLADAPRIRRGMVIATSSMNTLDSGVPPQASRGFTAAFDEDAAQFPPPGTLVNVLFGCVRTAARILDVSVQHRDEADDDDAAGAADQGTKADAVKPSLKDATTKVSVELIHSRKWAESGSSVIIMANGTQDGSGLQGFVGKITDVVC
ncbi:hypothetical protein Trco_000981 [Trichoderma cornu-damae]|uniref:t-SNARE coiled-coil homology domain-containing protein n=1 Tax=Trichoderma cornu-damae TaxID=654480 RepID=A0A9P8QRC9_9HYPO|nr:hypothetical protein Trco_000981 [Trichoderma cornu-damae]